MDAVALFGGAIGWFALTAPPVVAATVAISRRRSVGCGPRERRRRAALDAAVACALLGIAVVTLLPLDAGTGASRLQLTPLASIVDVLRTSVSAGVAARIVGLNVVLFLPLGFLLMLRTGRWATTVGAAVATSVAIEVLQAVLPLGRTTNVDDVVLNVAGALLGAAAARIAASVSRSPAAGGRPTVGPPPAARRAG
jgi:hypothetical protein